MTEFLRTMREYMAQLQRMARDRQIQSQPKSVLPKDWVVLTGEPATTLKEIKTFEQQCERACFATWKQTVDRFEECIGPENSRLADLYYVWKASHEYQAVKRLAHATGQDNLFHVLYDWVRMKLFESCDLDPDEPRRQANAEWKRALSNLPKDTLSWHILDKVERAMNNARELRKETGALDEFDPEHLREELENIREAIPRGSKFHRVIYGDKNVAIDSYATLMAQIE